MIENSNISDEDSAWYELMHFYATHLVSGPSWIEFIKIIELTLLDFPDALPENLPEELLTPMSNSIALFLWNSLPHPNKQFKFANKKEPRANDPCSCGSTIKYKKCCMHAPKFPPMSHAEGWALMLDVLPDKDIAKLARNTSLNLSAQGQVAFALLYRGKPKLSMQLLSSVFAEPSNLCEKHEIHLDVYLDSLDALGYKNKKKSEMKRLLPLLQPKLRSTLWQRYALIRSDQGDYPGAWQAFENSMRDYPDNWSLGQLEVTLLLAESNTEKAKQRAQFWLAKLKRSSSADENPRIMDFFEKVIQNPEKAFTSLDQFANPDQLNDFYDLLQTLPNLDIMPYEIIVDEEFEPLDHDIGEHEDPFLNIQMNIIRTPSKTYALESKWMPLWSSMDNEISQPMQYEYEDIDEANDYWAPENVELWLDFLSKHPIAFNSFNILNDLLFAIDQLQNAESQWTNNALTMPILLHAKKILSKTMNVAKTTSLPWMVQENQAALSLLVILIQSTEINSNEWPKLAEFYLQLNSDDSHGIRASLSNKYTKENNNQKVLLLCDNYPHDLLPEIVFNRILALFRTNQLAAAQRQLKKSKQQFPHIYEYLIATKKPHKPKIDSPLFVTPGGKDQAWLYYSEMYADWNTTDGAINWLREIKNQRELEF